MSRSKALFAGLMAGLIAGIAMTTVMLLLACFGVATPLAIIGDRLSVFIPPGPFLTLLGFALSVFVFERVLVGGFHFVARPNVAGEAGEFSPAIGRRSLIVGGLGLVVAGGGIALLRKLYRVATFSYDGTQYKGRIVQ